jgi:hypothetical protein
MAARTNWTLEEFTKAVKKHLNFRGWIGIEPLGFDGWEIRPEFKYAVRETKKITIYLHDTDGKKHDLKGEGNRSLEEVSQFIRQK